MSRGRHAAPGCPRLTALLQRLVRTVLRRKALSADEPQLSLSVYGETEPAGKTDFVRAGIARARLAGVRVVTFDPKAGDSHRQWMRPAAEEE